MFDTSFGFGFHLKSLVFKSLTKNVLTGCFERVVGKIFQNASCEDVGGKCQDSCHRESFIWR